MKPDCTLHSLAFKIAQSGCRPYFGWLAGYLFLLDKVQSANNCLMALGCLLMRFWSIASASVGLFGGEVQGRICTLCNEHRFTIDHHQRRCHRPCLSLGTEVVI